MIKIKLTQGKSAIVDDVDGHLANWNWYAAFSPSTKTFYAVRKTKLASGRWISTYLTHALVGIPISNALVVDHRDGNTLDCRRENLRLTDRRVNRSNSGRRRGGKTTSIFVGVYWYARSQRWRADIRIGGRGRYLGYFDHEEDAAAAYQAALAKLERR